MQLMQKLFLATLLPLHLAAMNLDQTEEKKQDEETVICGTCRDNLDITQILNIADLSLDNATIQLTCGHTSHFACLSSAALRDNRCQECRAPYELHVLAASSVAELKHCLAAKDLELQSMQQANTNQTNMLEELQAREQGYQDTNTLLQEELAETTNEVQRQKNNVAEFRRTARDAHNRIRTLQEANNVLGQQLRTLQERHQEAIRAANSVPIEQHQVAPIAAPSHVVPIAPALPYNPELNRPNLPNWRNRAERFHPYPHNQNPQNRHRQ